MKGPGAIGRVYEVNGGSSALLLRRQTCNFVLEQEHLFQWPTTKDILKSDIKRVFIARINLLYIEWHLCRMIYNEILNEAPQPVCGAF